MPGLGALPTAGPEGLRELLGIPAFGHTREQQAQQQALMRALLDYQQASARYQQLMARAQGEGAQRLQRKLAELGATAPTLKAMYDLWVDAVEEAYAEIALSDEFREAYAAQTNTQMQLRHLQRKQMEQWCREFSLPTRSEVDTLGQRVQELRRQIRRMESSKLVNASATDGMDVETPKRRAVANTRAPAKKSAKTAPRRAPRKSR